MEKEEVIEKTVLGYITLHGQNGCGGEDFDDNALLYLPIKRCNTIKGYKIDLGQGNCIRHFNDQLKNFAWNFEKTKPELVGKKVLFGFSQGTATIINWLAQKEQINQDKKVAAVVLQAVLGNGNNAILHNAERMIKPITYLPFARFWIPWVTKAFFPTYNPWGKQALSSASKLSPNIPVIILHDQNDPETPINDARKLYCALIKNREDNNVYLIETNNRYISHVNILYSMTREKRHETVGIMNVIYKKLNLPYQDKITIREERDHNDLSKIINPQQEILIDLEKDLHPFQPSVEEVEARIKACPSTKRGIFRNAIDMLSGTALLGSLAYYTYYKWNK